MAETNLRVGIGQRTAWRLRPMMTFAGFWAFWSWPDRSKARWVVYVATASPMQQELCGKSRSVIPYQLAQSILELFA